MIEQPKLRSHLHAEVIGDDRTLLIAEGRYFALHGRLYTKLVPLLDGQLTTDQIVDRLAAAFHQTEIYHALLSLVKSGYVEESTSALPDSLKAFWNTLGIDSRTAADRLASRAICVTVFGGAGGEPFLSLLDSLCVRSTSAAAADLWVALVDDYLREGLSQFNRQALESGTPWLIVRPNGVFSWIGPIFRPRETACWACLAQRLKGNFEVEEFARTFGKRPAPYPARASLPSTLHAGLGIAATEAAKWIVLGKSEALESRIITFDSISLGTQEHIVVRRPQCPECGAGDDAARSPRPVDIASVRKAFVADGGHRSVSPEQTLRKYSHHISPITGIAKGLFRVTGQDDTTVNVYVTGNNMAVRHNSFDRLRRNIRSSCCGKGITDAQARASALCEAIERYSGVFRGEEIRQKSSARALGDRAINPQQCMLFSDAQYSQRDQWNQHERRLDMVPLPFDEKQEMDWSPLWSLTRKELRYLPTSFCYYSYPSLPEHFYCLPESNGCAGGNTVEEAILQGFLELVERDAVAVWWYNRLSRPAVDLDSFDDPFIRDLKAHYRGLGRDLWVLDLTHDLRAPAFIAVSRRVDRQVEDIIFAPAAHFDARLGVVRALTELNQMLPGVSTSKADGSGYGYDDPEAVQWWRTATLENQPYLAPAEGIAPTRYCDYPRLETQDLRDDVLYCQSIVEGLGLEMLVLDQTRLDIGLPVVKVVVPGLRHFWARFAPGRLYDVPVKMGWLRGPAVEEALNPIPVFI
ncbi:MAG TPA: TOMM precursor leader peptide-binding protein [Blastocatellia bacterium]|nr:TOMM precursor leader peptide-binding protein [Blastocatellia bacterium]